MNIIQYFEEGAIAITRDRKYFLQITPEDVYFLSVDDMCRWAEAQIPDDEKSGIRNYFFSDLLDEKSRIWDSEDFSGKIKQYAWEKYKCQLVMGRWERYWENTTRLDERTHAPSGGESGFYTKRFIQNPVGLQVGWIESNSGIINVEGVDDLKGSIIYLLERAGITTKEALKAELGDILFPPEVTGVDTICYPDDEKGTVAVKALYCSLKSLLDKIEGENARKGGLSCTTSIKDGVKELDKVLKFYKEHLK